jgi:hypothetical protein
MVVVSAASNCSMFVLFHSSGQRRKILAAGHVSKNRRNSMSDFNSSSLLSFGISLVTSAQSWLQ